MPEDFDFGPPIATIETYTSDDAFVDESDQLTSEDVGFSHPGTEQIAEEQRGPQYYPDYRIDSNYEHHQGLLQMPVGGPPGTPPELIQVHAGYWTRVVQWTAERIGAKPNLPETTPIDSNEALQYASVQPGNPAIGPDGKRYYRVSGSYVYVLAGAPEKFEAGKAAYDLLPVGDQAVTAFQFVGGLLG